jgi:putative chitobiose transport system permease protein
MGPTQPLAIPAAPARPAARTATRRHFVQNIFWYALLCLIAVITVVPFLWMLLTSFKGPTDTVISMPPQLLPHAPTFANYVRVWNQLPVGRFFLNSLTVSVCTVVLNVIVTSLAAYPLAKMKFAGRDVIFYLLLATLIVPPQLTFIPSYVLAVNVFKYYNTLASLILPGMCSAFNIFLLRQAFKTVPNDLLDAARIDGASEFRIWARIMLPVIRPSLATVAIFTFVISWNDYLWPSLMLHTRELLTLPVGLVALQGMFTSDFRATAAGVTLTVIPILIFFIVLQGQFIRGLSGSVKG